LAASRKKIPVTVVTGFLGAGKTTFINNLLKQNQKVKIAIVENEFGDVSIDSALIANYNPGSVLELNNGCICCSLFNEFSLALQELVKQNDEFDQLIIETTGVADPEPILEPFLQDADLKRLFDFKGTVCLVDAMTFQEKIGRFEQMKQIVLADLILVNKASNANSEKLEYVRKKVLALNNTAPVVETDFAVVEEMHLDGLHAQLYDDFVKKLRRPVFYEPEVTPFYSFSVRFGGSVDENRFREWFTYFVSFYRKKIFRIKGLMLFESSALYSVIQAVGGKYSVTDGPMTNPFETPQNVLVFIGQDISKLEVEKEINAFLAPEFD
jgi:G3E family GTPase